MAPHRILVVDDEPMVRSVLRAGLEAEGWTVREAGNGDDAIAALKQEEIDLVTLDLGLKGQDGIDVARRIRNIGDIPILMISGRNQPIDRVVGLEEGAVDYIAKPFHIREVVIRIAKALARRDPSVPAESQLRFDHCTYDPALGVILHDDGTTNDLTRLEQQLLTLFVTHPNRVLSRDEIAQTIHGRDWSPLDRTIDGHVTRLRRKLEPQGDIHRSLLRSARGVGYVFASSVSPIAASS